jgi:predicted MPP superfamily phosphohydrolase
MSRDLDMRRLISLLFLLLTGLLLPLKAQQLTLPAKPDSVRFAAIGDMGTGESPQYEVARQMAAYRQMFPFDFVIMLGDNIYGGHSASDFEQKFAVPYKPLLDAGVKFYAALGNHDDSTAELFYKLFNMNGQRSYAYKKGDVHFFVLDSNYMDPAQLQWLQNELQKSAGNEWRICYFHHPLYSSGKTHGSALELRKLLEPLFIKYGINVVFAGHDHVYERVKPQHGIYYFTEGAAGELRKGDLKKTDMTDKGFDQDQSFMLVEVAGDVLYFQTISRTGITVDSGMIQKAAGAQPAVAVPGTVGAAQPLTNGRSLNTDNSFAPLP